ncbi:MAG: hypothetical protein KGZ71_05935 [Desulfobulbaceae bacterium]|nr:hypothetical protein [Candidatus Kapabacteria bacterium]MBS4000002.1 hypothetical protein [Desulfobulbaceae bacterium]
MKKNILPSIIIILVMVYGCASPKPVYRLQVVDKENISFRYGSEYVAMNYNRLYLEAAYIESYDGFHVFYVTVSNESGLKAVVDPANFFYVVDKIDPYLEKKPDILPNDTVMADSPEERLLKIEMDFSNQIAADENIVGRQILTGIITTVVDVAVTEAIGGNDEAKSEALSERQAVRMEMYKVDRENSKLLIVSMAERKEFWATEVLRKTTLFPGYEVGGYVFVKHYDEIEQMTLNFRIEGISYPITYLQVVYEPY